MRATDLGQRDDTKHTDGQKWPESGGYAAAGGNGDAQVTGKPVEQLFKGGPAAGADANMSS